MILLTRGGSAGSSCEDLIGALVLIGRPTFDISLLGHGAVSPLEAAETL